jgi:hypothetical protein
MTCASRAHQQLAMTLICSTIERRGCPIGASQSHRSHDVMLIPLEGYNRRRACPHWRSPHKHWMSLLTSLQTTVLQLSHVANERDRCKED